MLKIRINRKKYFLLVISVYVFYIMIIVDLLLLDFLLYLFKYCQCYILYFVCFLQIFGIINVMKFYKNKIYEIELFLFLCDFKMCIIINIIFYCVCELIYQIFLVSKLNQMIIFYFENGCVVIFWISGIELKIKYYIEFVCQLGDKYVDFFD